MSETRSSSAPDSSGGASRAGTSVWVENTPYGDAKVVVLNPSIGGRPFCYCSFHYRAGYTDADSVHRAAERMAIALGAKAPVRFVARFEC